MAKRYNPPPGWLVPVGEWRPSFAWQPDPSWPPAPVGWHFWVEPEPEPQSVAVAVPRQISRRHAGAVIGAVVLAGLIAVGAVGLAGVFGAGSATSVALAAAPSPQVTAAAVLPEPAPASALLAPAKTQVKAVNRAVGRASQAQLKRSRTSPASRTAIHTPAKAGQQAKADRSKAGRSKVSKPTANAGTPATTPNRPTTSPQARHHRHHHQSGALPNLFWFLTHLGHRP